LCRDSNQCTISSALEVKREKIMNEELTISEVARRAGVRTSALRYYESIGLLPAVRRVNGQRRYSPSAVQMLGVIHLAQQAGFSMAEIQTLVHGFAPETAPPERWRPLAEHKLGEIDALIARAQQMRRILETLLQCGCVSLEQCGSDSGAHCG
jgi:MerR family redox-sensitive transcriptional activator SoxR